MSNEGILLKRSFYKKKKKKKQLDSWAGETQLVGSRSGCRLNLPQVRSQRDELMRHLRMPRLTCTDSDGANKLLPPAAAPHHQSQVRLLDQLVHRALQRHRRQKETYLVNFFFFFKNSFKILLMQRSLGRNILQEVTAQSQTSPTKSLKSDNFLWSKSPGFPFDVLQLLYFNSLQFTSSPDGQMLYLLLQPLTIVAVS